MQNVPNIVREGLKASAPADNHPDADLLTAFAERSLSDRERSTVLEHLSRCGDCRDILALALPATETEQIVVSPMPNRWLTWPALRWGFVAAGVIAVASVGIVKYQRNMQSPATASALRPPAAVEVAANEPKTAPRFNVSPEDKKQKLQAPSAPVAADSLDANTSATESRGNNEKKAITREESIPSRRAAVGGQLPHGPRVSNLYQQQNAQNQAPAPAPPSAYDRLQSFHESAPSGGAMPATISGPSALSKTEVSNAVPAVARAKPAMPLPSRADATTNSLSDQDRAVTSRLQSGPGQISGSVVDPSGAVVANARVTIIPTAPTKTGTASAVTNSQGTWLIAGLPTGNYKAQAAAPGFKTTVLDLNYDASQPSQYNFTLNPGSVSETVEVSAQSAQTETVTSSAVGQGRLSGRNLTQLAVVTGAPVPRWSISATGALQRSIDQGNTWQTVNVIAASSSNTNATSLEIVAKSSGARMKEKDAAKAGKRDSATPVFRAVAANGSDVWAGGSAGVLYHSADAGSTWTRVFPASSGASLTGDIVSLQFPEPQHGTLSTSTTETWATADAGQTWQKQ